MNLVAQTAPVQRIPSPDGRLAVEYRDCQAVADCRPEVRVTDAEGRILRYVESNWLRFDGVVWVGNERFGLESGQEFHEFRASDGRKQRELVGVCFLPAPDGKSVAHHGWVTASAPVWVQSDWLLVDETHIYPLAQQGKPAEHRGVTGPPEIVEERSGGYFGIHHFRNMRWSADSRYIALLDFVDDFLGGWNAQGEIEGESAHGKLYAVIVGRDGRNTRLEIPQPEDWQTEKISLEWVDARTVRITLPDGQQISLKAP